MNDATTNSQLRVVGIGGRPVAERSPDVLKRALLAALAVAVLTVASIFVFSTRSAAHQPAAELTASAATLWAE